MADTNESSSNTRAARRPAWKRVLKIGVGALAGLVAIAVLVAVLFGDRWAERYITRRLPEVQQKLGRVVRLRDVDVSLLRGRLQVHELSIGAAADEPSDAPALAVAEASINVGVWRTLLSLGRSPYVESIEVDGLQVDVIKRRDGSLNWQRIAERLSSEPNQSAQARPKQPTSAEGGTENRSLRNATVGSVVLQRSGVRFVEQGRTAKPASISQIDVRMSNVGYGAATQLALKAAVLASQRNLELHAKLDEGDREQLLTRLEQLSLHMQPAQLAPLAPFLAASSEPGRAQRSLERGVLSASMDVSKQGDQALATKGWLALAGARFSGGTPFDARMEVDVLRDARAGRLDVRNLALSAEKMKLIARGRVSTSGKSANVQQLALRSENLSFDGIRRLYPAFDARTAPARLDGPFSIAASGGGSQAQQHVQLELRLTDAVIDVRDDLHKPRGIPLVLEAKLQTAADRTTIEHATLQLADFQLAAQGQVRTPQDSEPSYDITLSTPKPEVDSLLRLLPPLARAGGGRALPGKLTLNAAFKKAAGRSNADGVLRISDLNVSAKDARFAGGGSAKLSVRDEPKSGRGQLDADFTQLTASYRDVVQKPRGTPLRANARWTRQGEHTDAHVTATVASLAAQADLKLRGAGDKQSYAVNAKIPQFAIRPLLALLPQLGPKAVGDLRVGADVRARGVAGSPASLRVEVPQFVVQAKRSDLRGSLRFSNADNPQLAALIRSKYLDTQELVPKQHEPNEEEQPESNESPLAKVDGTLDARIDAGRISGVPFEKLVAKLVLRDGRASAKTLEVAAFGGKLSGSGSELPLTAAAGPVHIKGNVSEMHVDSVLERFADAPKLLAGQLSGRVDVSSKDLSVEALKNTLSGKLDGNVKDATFVPGNGYGKLAESLQESAKSIPGLDKKLAGAEKRLGNPDRPWKLRDLAGSLRFENGAALLAKPLTADTPDGKLSVQGRIGVGSASDLDGTLALTPEAVSTLTAGKLEVDKPVPVPFSVDGPLTHPEFGFQVEPVLKPLVKAYAGKEGEQQLDKALERSGAPKPSKKVERQVEKKLHGLF